MQCFVFREDAKVAEAGSEGKKKTSINSNQKTWKYVIKNVEELPSITDAECLRFMFLSIRYKQEHGASQEQ